MASNTESRFAPFEVLVANTVVITGIKYLPATRSESGSTSDYRPLIILLHGGGCTAHHFDLSPSMTISTIAEALSVPVISINRPGYLGSDRLPATQGSRFHKDLGSFYHSHLFPKLWADFGIAHGCKAVVPLAHSLGSPAVIIAAGLHAREQSPSYPLAGIIMSGWGELPSPRMPPSPRDRSQKLDWKRVVMCGPSEDHCAPVQALEAIGIQDHNMESQELEEVINGDWNSYWYRFADDIMVPIMFSLGEHDLFWEGSTVHLIQFGSRFPKCPRFDGAVVKGAPHAIEWSHCAQGWMARCLGFAQEVTAGLALGA
ncbi:hypothetical protein H2204_013687 [Knufia peltigerae]|uniref:AB hydrolase-1 domain-containing protein n=1 Tax=Knufia peltigerae TaxID=1002370 RepID=A0AA38XQD7_9EURO|nr:hypothetical protein H2204_013687 [Knufia peltigerae]